MQITRQNLAHELALQMRSEFPSAEFWHYIVAWIAETDAARERGVLVGAGFTGSAARKLRRIIDSILKRLTKTLADPEFRSVYVPALLPVGMEAIEALINLQFRISVDSQAALASQAKEQELGLLYVASLFLSDASVAREIRNAGGRRREPRTITEGLRKFRSNHDQLSLARIVEQYFGFFRLAQFRKQNPGKQRDITGLRLSGVSQKEFVAISRLIRKDEARHKSKN